MVGYEKSTSLKLFDELLAEPLCSSCHNEKVRSGSLHMSFAGGLANRCWKIIDRFWAYMTTSTSVAARIGPLQPHNHKRKFYTRESIIRAL